MKNVNYRHTVPIFNFELRLIVADEPRKIAERLPAFSESLARYPAGGHGPAFFMYNNHTYGLFFRSKPTSNSISHEVRHCVDMMLDVIGQEFRPGDELSSYLSGYLTELISRQLAKAKIKVSL